MLYNILRVVTYLESIPAQRNPDQLESLDTIHFDLLSVDLMMYIL